MQTKIAEIADGIYRLSTYVPEIAPPAGFAFNQFLILGDQPLMFHTGLRKMFPLNREALARIIPPEKLRWIAFGHYEADECGAMNEWLKVAPGVAWVTRAVVTTPVAMPLEAASSHSVSNGASSAALQSLRAADCPMPSTPSRVLAPVAIADIVPAESGVCESVL